MAEVFDQSRRLFELPLDAKMELLRNKNYRGYTPYLDQHLDPENQVHGLYYIIRKVQFLVVFCGLKFRVFVLVS